MVCYYLSALKKGNGTLEPWNLVGLLRVELEPEAMASGMARLMSSWFRPQSGRGILESETSGSNENGKLSGLKQRKLRAEP